MTVTEMYEFMNANPGFHLATLDGDQPRVRGMFLYRADQNGIIFHTGTFKDLYKQIQAHPKAELCFNDYKRNIQIRVWGALETINDNAFKNEIASHPTRAFLRPWRDSIPAEEFYKNFIVYRLKNAQAVVWTFETNRAPKKVVQL